MLLPGLSCAQPAAWSPTANVEIIAPAGPGSALDQTARALQRSLQNEKLIATPMTIVNRPGGGQVLGFTYLNQGKPDGHHVAIGTISLLTNRITGLNQLNYEDVTPISNLVAEYVVFAVRTESPLARGKDLADRLRADPRSVSVGFSGSPGNHNHMAIGLLGQASGAEVQKLKTVVFNSGGELATALLGGHLDVAVGGSSVFANHVQAGRLRLLAVTAPKRLGGQLGNVPTWTENGLAVTFSTFRGIVGPKGMPSASVRFWENVLSKVSADDEWKKFLQASDSESLFLGSTEFRKMLDAENTRVRGILRDIGLAK